MVAYAPGVGIGPRLIAAVNGPKRGAVLVQAHAQFALAPALVPESMSARRGFKAIGKADKKLILVTGRRARDNADRAARMDERVVRSPHFNQGHDLRPCENVIRLVRHCQRKIANNSIGSQTPRPGRAFFFRPGSRETYRDWAKSHASRAYNNADPGGRCGGFALFA